MLDILSITHTNPLDDSRLLKYRDTAEKMGISYYSVGLERGTHMGSEKNTTLVRLSTKPYVDKVVNRISKFRTICILIRFVYYFEASLKLIYAGLRYKPKVIHAHDWFVLPAALLINKFTRSKLIYDAHELESEANGVSPELRFLALMIERISWPRVDIFVTVSPSISDWYLERFGKKESRIILNSPVTYSDSKEISAVENDYFRSKFDISKDSKIFLSLGAIEKGRGVEILLEAFAQTDQDVYLIFMGQGTLASLVRERSLKNKKILIHPQVPHALVTSIASSADYGMCIIENVSLSDWLCLPNKLFEYAFAGLPVIASNFPELSRVIAEFGLGACIAPTEDSLLSILQNAADLPQRMIPTDFAMIEPLGWKSQERKIVEMYKSLLI